MSSKVVLDDDVATATVASNQTSASGCCCSPCGAIKGAVAAVLGTVQILVGVANVGLGAGRTRTRPGDFAGLGAAYWIGAVFVTTGVLSVLSGQCPSCCFNSLTVTANVSCAVLSAVAVVLYALDLAALSADLFCGDGWYDNGCREAASYAVRLTRAMDITLLVLALLVLCASVLAAIAAAVAAAPPAQRDEEVEEFHPGVKVFLLDLDRDHPALKLPQRPPGRIQMYNLAS
ncbi:uncharacterized protein LOC133479186 isoform X2 [Phyllopteryx taeniolatus]|uniref:uncharacterized protein LOC133479186 isoform X2 n=1 Tax=Phyllopteryx taeniolatus TaxID=161469 RepID=UPI002AD46C81|nr:uncharacterized protein LOC133479186 isoform X2 [Phyllopteryx taeniolatus]